MVFLSSLCWLNMFKQLFSKGHHWLKCMENRHRSSFSFNGRKMLLADEKSELQTCQSLGRLVLVTMSLGHGEKSGIKTRLRHVKQLLKYRELTGSYLIYHINWWNMSGINMHLLEYKLHKSQGDRDIERERETEKSINVYQSTFPTPLAS